MEIIKIKVINYFIALTLFFFSFANYANAENLKVCIDPDNEPYTSIDKNKRATGMLIELWDAMQISNSYTYLPVELTAGMARLEEKTCDIFLINLTVNRARAKRIDFSTSFLSAGIGIMVNKNNNKILSPADLQGKAVAVSGDTTADQYMAKNIKTDFILVIQGSDQKLYDLLLAGKVDAIVHDLPSLQYFQQNQAQNHVKVLDNVLIKEDYAFGLPKNSNLKPIVDEKIAILKENGTIDNLYKKWLN